MTEQYAKLYSEEPVNDQTPYLLGIPEGENRYRLTSLHAQIKDYAPDDLVLAETVHRAGDPYFLITDLAEDGGNDAITITFTRPWEHIDIQAVVESLTALGGNVKQAEAETGAVVMPRALFAPILATLQEAFDNNVVRAWTVIKGATKVFFIEEDGAYTESLWAEPLGNNLFRLKNIPFGVSGYAEADVVHCRRVPSHEVDADTNDYIYQVVEMTEDSGNLTVILTFAQGWDTPETQYVIDQLHEQACSFERSSEQICAMTIPAASSANLMVIYNILDQATKRGPLTTWSVLKGPTYEEITG